MPNKLRYARRTFARDLGDDRTAVGKVANRLADGYLIRLQHPPSALNQPRYGYGRPSHPRLTSILSRGDHQYSQVLEGFRPYSEDLAAIPFDREDPGEPYWRNTLLFGLDGVSLYCFTRQRTPHLYVEIGSGNSTLFVDRARRDGNVDLEIVSIDPYPRVEVDAVCDRSIRQPLETADLSVFDGVKEGDMVFLDGSHRVYMNSDVSVFFLDVLPELPPGVLVGIHDIHLPDDYFQRQAYRFYSEQYMLASYLLAGCDWIQPLLPCWYVSNHPDLGSVANSLVPQYLEGAPFGEHSLAREFPIGVIFWLLTQPHA